jgi:virginiamycin B lyase
MWFSGTTVVGRLTPQGGFGILQAGFPFPGGTPGHCVNGPDGAVWFPTGAGTIGRVDVLTQASGVFQLPAGSVAADLVMGPDGAIWFTDFPQNRIGRMTTSGVVTEFSLPSAFILPHSICLGPDGAFWFTSDAAQVGRIDMSGGGFRYYNLPENSGNIYAQFSAITTGSDGNLWLGVLPPSGAGRVVRLTPTGSITEFPLQNGFPLDITAGPDGALWFTEVGADKIGRMTTAGALTEYSLQPNSGPVGITVGPDNAIWFTEIASRVGRISGGPLVLAATVPTLGTAMLVLLGASLAFCGWFVARRRSH